MKMEIWNKNAWTPSLQWEGDTFIMNRFLEIPGVKLSQLWHANMVQLYLQVITIYVILLAHISPVVCSMGIGRQAPIFSGPSNHSHLCHILEFSASSSGSPSVLICPSTTIMTIAWILAHPLANGWQPLDIGQRMNCIGGRRMTQNFMC
jgi:hypothetical protein